MNVKQELEWRRTMVRGGAAASDCEGTQYLHHGGDLPDLPRADVGIKGIGVREHGTARMSADGGGSTPQQART